jgi:hypothetical protein
LQGSGQILACPLPILEPEVTAFDVDASHASLDPIVHLSLHKLAMLDGRRLRSSQTQRDYRDEER